MCASRFVGVLGESLALNFTTTAAARAGFKDLLDTAVAGLPATVTRDRHTVAAVDSTRLGRELRLLVPCEAHLGESGEGWSFSIEGLPISAEGDTIDH